MFPSFSEAYMYKLYEIYDLREKILKSYFIRFTKIYATIKAL